jgi:hypothetical protein
MAVRRRVLARENQRRLRQGQADSNRPVLHREF